MIEAAPAPSERTPVSAAVAARPAVHDLLAVDHALEHLERTWVDLWIARLIGTPRPWTEPVVSPETRARMDARARMEKHDLSVDGMGNVIAVGESPAPMHVEVLDLLVTVGGLAAAMTAEVARVTAHPAPWPNPDPRPRLLYVRRNLADAPVILELYAGELLAVEIEVDRTLRLVRDGHVLKAVCPWCKGMGKRALTLVVRELPGIGAAVVCTTPGCNPPQDAYPLLWRGHPTWTLPWWDDLASQLLPVDQA